MESENKDTWVEFASSYLKLVELACKACSPNYHQPNIRIAVIYNIKHAIELLMKCIIKLVEEDREREIIISHNLDSIFKKLKKAIESKDFVFKKNQEELKEYIEQERKEWKKGRYFVKIQLIINYYQRLEFLENKLAQIADDKNTFFRYPEDEKGLKYEIDYFTFIYNNDFDSEKILEDTRELSFCLNSIKTIFL